MFYTVLLLLLFCQQTSWAEEYSKTAVKFLYGSNFHDPQFDTDTQDGRMGTIQLQHFGLWNYGENYFEADLYQGNFVGDGISDGNSSRIFAKWVTRLSAAKISGKAEGFQFGVVRDLLLAARIDRQGNGFYANMVGVGLTLFPNSSLKVGSDFYLRKDKFNHATFQASPYWHLPFQSGSAQFLATGFIDLAGTDLFGADLSSTPEFLWDAGAVFKENDRLLLGVALSYHHNSVTHDFAPQGEFRWIF